MALSYSNTVSPAASNALSNYLSPKLTIGGGTSQTTPAALPKYKPSSTGYTVTPQTSNGPSLSIGGPTSTVGSGANANAAAINKAHVATLAALTGGGTAGAGGTPTLTQEQLTAQNGGVANLPQTALQNNNGTTGGATTVGAPALSYGGLVGGLVNTGKSAADIAADYGSRIASVGKAGAAAQGGLLTTGTTPVAEGRAAVVAQTTAAQQSALAQGETAALQGTSQQITAGNEAAGFAQPQVTSPGQAVFNPLTGTYSNASSGGAQASTAPSGIDQTAWNQYVNDYATGNFGAIPSSITGNANLSGQLQQAVQAAHPGFSYNSALGAGQATQSNAQTAGTTQTNTAASGYAAAVQTYQQMNTVNSAADSQITQVQSILSSTGLNQGVPDYNKAINSLSARLGSTGVTQLTTAVTELQNIYSQLLSSGGTTPSGSEAQALALLNPNSSAAQINAAIGQLQTAAYNKLNAQYQQAATYQSALGGGSGGGSSASTSGFGWNG